MVQSFFVPGLIPSLNELSRDKAVSSGKGARRWNPYNDKKKAWKEKVALAALKLKPMPAGAHFRFTFYEKNRRRDPDNFTSSGHKFVLDGLVPRVIPNDGWDGVLSIRDEWAVVRSTQNEVGILVELSDDGEFDEN